MLVKHDKGQPRARRVALSLLLKSSHPLAESLAQLLRCSEEASAQLPVPCAR
jgi:hypothetical protein